MRISRVLARSAALAILAACGHGEPMTIPGHDTDQPLVPGVPVRLTYNIGSDRDAAWLPDESGLIYSSDQLDRADDDRCLVLLPPNGGRITRRWCNNAPAANDTVNGYDAAAPNAQNLFAFIRTGRLPAQTSPGVAEFVVANRDSMSGAQILTSLPFSLGARLYQTVSGVRWLDASNLVLRGDFSSVVCIGPGAPCPQAFVTSGLDVLTLDVAAGGAPVAVPGTALASSMALDPLGDALFYTLQNDFRIYRRVLSTGMTTVVYSFPATTIVRGVQVAGSRLVALIDGLVTILDPAVTGAGGPLQWDQGGNLVLIDLGAGTVTPLQGDTTRYLRPAVSPSGTRLVAEASGDLWLFTLP